MWSLGIIFYQLVSSWDHPFNTSTSNIQKMEKFIKNESPAALSASTPIYIKEIIEELL